MNAVIAREILEDSLMHAEGWVFADAFVMMLKECGFPTVGKFSVSPVFRGYTRDGVFCDYSIEVV